jgi:superfamily II DNA or RNA helicase
MTAFTDEHFIATSSWAAFERLVSRILLAEGYENPRIVGGSGDGGADVLASRAKKRFLFQVKRWSQPVGSDVLKNTVLALQLYHAEIPVIVSRYGFTQEALRYRDTMRDQGVNIQLWDAEHLRKAGVRLENEPIAQRMPELFGQPRRYQEQAIQRIVHRFQDDPQGSGLVVLATGLGKTFVATEAIRRLALVHPGIRVLVLAHTKALVYQLERQFWPVLRKDQASAVIMDGDRPDASSFRSFSVLVSTRGSMASLLRGQAELGPFDLVLVDECHHLEAAEYEEVLDALGVGTSDGPFLLGLTATPWRPDGEGLDKHFSDTIISMDLIDGLKQGFLSDVDYRMYTDNFNWDALADLRGESFSPTKINRTLFIDEWDDAVVDRMSEVWREEGGPTKGIVFCGTIDHAQRVAARVNALGFAKAEAIHSNSPRGNGLQVDQQRLLMDFSDGRIQILCTVDLLNEGIDVPDVDLVVFQRVTHSRRIFIQQLGRGLRLASGKRRVIVLDFVSDIKRFAEGVRMRSELGMSGPRQGEPVRIRTNSRIEFYRQKSVDNDGAAFLEEWLGDYREVEARGEDVSELRFPPHLR